MAKVAIVTDSTANIPTAVANGFPIHVVPLQVIWGERSYRDGIDILTDEFYSRLKTDKVHPSTSQPSPADFRSVYSRLLDEGYDILSVVLSSKLSGTMDSAIQAKDSLDHNRIAIIDSKTTSMALGFAVLAAARLAAQGATLAECQTLTEKSILHTHVYFLVSTLEYLRKGGRIGGAAAFLGTMLNLKPILEVNDGLVDAIERVRTLNKAQDRLIELVAGQVEKFACPIRLAGLYTDSMDNAEALVSRARQRFGILDVAEVMLSPVSPVLGVHAGPGAMGLAVMAGI